MMSGEYDLISSSVSRPSALTVGCVNVPWPLIWTALPSWVANSAGNEWTWCRSTIPPDSNPDDRLVPTATYVLRSTPFADSVGPLMGSIFEHGPEQPPSTAASASTTASLIRMDVFMVVSPSPVVGRARPERVDVG